MRSEEKVQQVQITSDLRVADVLRRWPAAFDVFQRHGCPDMRSGIFAMMARVMRLRWAARVHKIPLAQLLDELNSCAKQQD